MTCAPAKLQPEAGHAKPSRLLFALYHGAHVLLPMRPYWVMQIDTLSRQRWTGSSIVAMILAHQLVSSGGQVSSEYKCHRLSLKRALVL